MQCKDCGKEITEEEATTYIQMDKNNMIEEYKSVLCQECRGKQLEKIEVDCQKCGKGHTFLLKKTDYLKRLKEAKAIVTFPRIYNCGIPFTKRLP